MKADNKNDLFGWRNTSGPNFGLTGFFFGELLESKIGKMLLAADRRQF